MQARLRFHITRFVPILVIAIAALSVVPAAADQPIREGLPNGPETLDASICGFAVDITIPTNKEFTTTFANGKQIVTGSLFATLTNDQTGRSTTVNISGPGVFAPHSDGTLTATLRGRSLIFLTPNEVAPGSPALLDVTNGPVVFEVNQAGHITSYDIRSASAQDMCAVLAG
jgi:hypothetical protein